MSDSAVDRNELADRIEGLAHGAVLVESERTMIVAALRSTSVQPDREETIHAICPHIKQWCDEAEIIPVVCEKCPATVKTSQGEGVQMCRLNAEAAADAILSAGMKG